MTRTRSTPDGDLAARRRAWNQVWDWLLSDPPTEEDIANGERIKVAAEREARRKKVRWIAHREQHVNIWTVDKVKNGATSLSVALYNRKRLRESNYDFRGTEGEQRCFEAYDGKRYPLAYYREYDETGRLPDTEECSLFG